MGMPEYSIDEKMSMVERGKTDPAPIDVAAALEKNDSCRVDELEPKHAQSSRSTRSFPFWGKLVLAAVALCCVAVAAALVSFALRSDDVCCAKPETLKYEPPFEEDLPLLSGRVLEGYADKPEFQSDLNKLAESYLNGIVARNFENNNYRNFGNSGVRVGVMGQADESTTKNRDSSFGAAPPAAGQPASGAVNKVDDYGTNDQEAGVNEGDKVLTNGEIAVAAHGEFLVGWNVTDGIQLLSMQLQPTGSQYTRPYVYTLLLKGNYLIVVAGGYGLEWQQAQEFILTNPKGTRVFVYDISKMMAGTNFDTTMLDLVAQRDLDGDFVTIRAIGNSIHIVQRSEVNLYNILGQPYERYNSKALGALDLESYSEEVRRLALAESIPKFVDQTTQEIMECGELPSLVRLNRWTTEEGQDPITSTTMEHFLYNSGYAQSYVSIVSFDLDDVALRGTEALKCLSIAGAFFPTGSWNTNVYSATDTMIMSVRGYNYSPEREMSIDSTYVVAFELDGPSAKPKALGNFDGYVLDQFSFRVHEGRVLEIGTTIQEQFMMRAFVDEILDRRLQRSQPMIEPAIVTVPTTENYIITAVLEGGNGSITEMDRLKLGKEGEVFTTIRFYGDLAYAVTFMRIDPFYVVDMSDKHNITIAGELDNITGWSSYLEPMNDAKTVMLAIGQEADERGAPIGISVSVFDARDFDDVALAARLVIGSDSDSWAGSEGLSEKNAIRFNPETGLLIIPLSLTSKYYYGHSAEGCFKGFRVYHVTFDNIVETCEVDLSAHYCPFYYNYNSLEPRAMIIRGNVMTTMGSSITMTDLTSCKPVWSTMLSHRAPFV